MKRALLILSLLLALAGAAARAQILSAKAFPDTTVGQKVSDAQANGCNPDTNVVCVIVIEPELSVFPPGTLPTPSARTVIVDYRSATLGPQIYGNGSAGAGLVGPFVLAKTSLAACYAAIPAGGGTCLVPPNYSETLAADLTMNKANAGFVFTGPFTITMGTFRVVVPVGTVGNFIDAYRPNGAASGFVYSGTGSAILVGDNTADTQTFRLSNVAVQSAQASGTLLTLVRTQYFSLDNLTFVGPAGATTLVAMKLDGTGSFTGDGVIRLPKCSGVLTCILFTGSGLNAGNSNTVIGGTMVSPATNAVALDFEASSTGNLVQNFDVENSATAVKFGGANQQNYVSIWHGGNTTDFNFGASSSGNWGAAIGATTTPVVTDAGTNNSVWWPQKFKVDAAGSVSVNRIKAVQGTTLTCAKVGTISAGWGTTASCNATSGTDTAGVIAITSAGTGQAANPTFVFTFADGTFTNAPVCVPGRSDSASPVAPWQISTTSATAVTFLFAGTPVAASTYFLNFVCVGK